MRAKNILHLCLAFGLVMCASLVVGCASATYITAKVPDNPLDKVAKQADGNWSVTRVDSNTLQLRKAWPTHSLLSLGYSASYANLFYDAAISELDVQYYFKSHQLLLLFLPMSLDAEPGFTGAALKPEMNEEIDAILQWSGGSVQSRRAGGRSEAFPPKKIGIGASEAEPKKQEDPR